MYAVGAFVELHVRKGYVVVAAQGNGYTRVVDVVESEHLVIEGQVEDRGQEIVAVSEKTGTVEDQVEDHYIAALHFHHTGEHAEEDTANRGEQRAQQLAEEALDEHGPEYLDLKKQLDLERQEDGVSGAGKAKDGLENASHCGQDPMSGAEEEIEERAMADWDDVAGAWAPESGEAAESKRKELLEHAGPAAVPASSAARKLPLQPELAPAQTGRFEGVAVGRLGAFYPLYAH